MGRRSDHSRAEQEAMILAAGGQLMAETGYARFSAREVGKRVNYSVGTVVNLYDGVDGLVVAINCETYALWSEFMERRLADAADADRVARLVAGYFDFAAQNLNRWSAIYEHRLPLGSDTPKPLAAARSILTDIVLREVMAILPPAAIAQAGSLTRSLIATVHGHCVFALNGSFAVLGEGGPQAVAPVAMAIAGVTESLRAHGATI